MEYPNICGLALQSQLFSLLNEKEEILEEKQKQFYCCSVQKLLEVHRYRHVLLLDCELFWKKMEFVGNTVLVFDVFDATKYSTKSTERNIKWKNYWRIHMCIE